MENLDNVRVGGSPGKAVLGWMKLPSLMEDESDDMKSCGLMRKGVNEKEKLMIHHLNNHCLFLS